MNSATSQRLELHGISRKSFAFWWMLLIPLVLVSGGVFSIIKTGVYEFMPTRYWFEYEKTVSEYENYPAGTKRVFFESYVEYKQNNMHMTWIDELRCSENGDGYYLVNTSITSGARNRRDYMTKPQRWAMKGDHPHLDATCYVESTAYVTLQGDIRKSQTVRSNVYEVVSDGGSAM